MHSATSLSDGGSAALFGSLHRIVQFLIANGHEVSLAKLRIQEPENKNRHSVYEHHPNAIRITGEDAFMQKVNHIHLDPVPAGSVGHPDDYMYSSARLWHGRATEAEPQITDHRQIGSRAA